MEIIEKVKIVSLAKERWNNTSIEEREAIGEKYKHFLKIEPIGWNHDFDTLEDRQRNVLVKGQLIRWYDSLPNKIKTKIMQNIGLSSFSSKWYRLSSSDKRKLLNCVIS